MSDKNLYSFLNGPAYRLIFDPGVRREILKLLAEMGGGGGGSTKATIISGNISNGGATVTLTSLAGLVVHAIIINDIVKTTGFTKQIGNNYVDFTDGTTVSPNDVVIFL